MNLKEAEETIEIYEDFEGISCTCFQNAPCSVCEKRPAKDMYEEAQSLIKLEQEKAIIRLEELLEHELGDYCFKWEILKNRIEFYEGNYYIDIEYYMYDRDKADILTFRIGEKAIEINKYEDIYEEIDIYEPSIKHLWMRIKWD